jgi:hypothetical protein
MCLLLCRLFWCGLTIVVSENERFASLKSNDLAIARQSLTDQLDDYFAAASRAYGQSAQ